MDYVETDFPSAGTFSSITYTGKTGDTCRYVLRLGRIHAAYRSDIRKLSSDAPGMARDAMLESLQTSMEVGIGNHPLYRQVGLWQPHDTISGLSQNVESGEWAILGIIHSRKLIVAGPPRKSISHGARVLEKMALQKRLGLQTPNIRRFLPFREYIVENIFRLPLTNIS